ncbi:hypothetical protein Tco_0772309 [Tanacetum coccineum]|uniref:Uncharacterized protein n=1 Tax=Tanacetum coccineum TaxID=301880 RepID=A0ABQ4ZLB3_9ASTR
MPIPMVMLSDEIKSSDDYAKYLAKSLGSKPVKIRAFPNEHSDSLSSSSSYSKEAVEDISSDEADDTEKFNDVKKADIEKDTEEQVAEEHVVKEQTGEEEHDTTIGSPTQPPQTQPKGSKIKRILKKSKKPESQVDTDELDSRVTRHKKTVNAMSRFNLPDVIDKFVKAYLNNVLPKDLPDFRKTKLEKSAKKSIPKYSTTSLDQAALNVYDQKDKLFKMTREFKSFNRHLTDKALYDALADDQDQDPSSDSAKEKKKRKQKDSEPSKKDKSQARSSKKESVEDDMVDTEIPHQANDSVPKRDSSKWFKEDSMVRPKTPNPKWQKEPTDAPEQPWFNDLVNPKKDPVTFEDVMGSVNQEGNRIPHDLSKPLPLQGPPSHLKIPVDFFFNKYLKYLTGGNTKRRYSTSLTKLKAVRDLNGNYSLEQDKQFNLVKCVLSNEDPQNYAKEPYTILHKPRGVVYLNMDNKKYLMRSDELYKFGDGTLKKVRDEQDCMLKNFEMGYNKVIPRRAWTDKDQEWTASVLEKIEKTLLIRWIIRSLECYVGGRNIKTNYRLLT